MNSLQCHSGMIYSILWYFHFYTENNFQSRSGTVIIFFSERIKIHFYPCCKLCMLYVVDTHSTRNHFAFNRANIYFRFGFCLMIDAWDSRTWKSESLNGFIMLFIIIQIEFFSNASTAAWGIKYRAIYSNVTSLFHFNPLYSYPHQHQFHWTFSVRNRCSYFELQIYHCTSLPLDFHMMGTAISPVLFFTFLRQASTSKLVLCLELMKSQWLTSIYAICI